MPPPDTNPKLDGLSYVRKGVNSGIAPRMLPVDQVAFAINATFRGGLPKTRPAWRKVPLTYGDTETETRATTALFQCASFYQAVGTGESCLIASIGGRLFRYLVGSTNVVQDVSIASDLNNSLLPDCWMWQSEDFLIVNNGYAYPLFFDGAGTRRSRGPAGSELPPGCMGVYVQGRNWWATPNRIGFMAGDLVYSHGFLDGYQGRSAVLKTEENTFLSGGGSFGVPVTAGRINAMSNVAIADTSLGQGPVQVLTTTAVFSVQVPLLREEWAAMQYPLMTIGLPNYGGLSQSSVVTVNGDLWYRSLDGIRSYQIARRDFNTWVNTPLSVEVENVLNLDDQTLLGQGSGVLFNNRLLQTCSPYDTDRGVAHRGLVVLDFNNISTLTARSNPAYDGLWTGLRILKIIKGTFSGNERCFAFALDTDGLICLYELLTDDAAWFDFNGDDYVSIASVLETRSMGWPDNGNTLKKLLCLDLYLDRLMGNDTVAFDFKYRSDEDPCWKDWHSFTLCAPFKDCSTADCPTFQNTREQYRTFIRLPDPRDTPCSAITKRTPRTGYEFQLRFSGAGFWQLNRMHTWALLMSDSVIKSCPTSETCVPLKCCDLPWFDYDIEPPPTPPPAPGEMVGIITEGPPDEPTWITTEPNVVLRTEDQPQTGDPNAPQPPPPPPLPPPLPPPVVTGPVWPVPAPACPGFVLFPPLTIADPLDTSSNFPVGIPTGGMIDPVSYLNIWSPDPTACLNAWISAVWADFVSSGTAYSSAELVWDEQPYGANWLAQQVFPDQSGGYVNVAPASTRLVVRYCP